jgi:hypothetical protein
MKTTCQVLMAVLLVIAVLKGLWQDVHGIPKHEPYGYSGIIITLITAGVFVWIYHTAGAFSELF